jgi:sigma-B regulation protein RsbU (phosphoserine phosphatase)
MKPGDVIFVYTDGIPEAVSGNKQFYGFDRLLDTLEAAGTTEPEALIDAVKKSVAGFTGDAEQFDDLTMLCMRFNGQD